MRLALTSTPVLTLLVKAPTPEVAAKLTLRQIALTLKGRRDVDAKAAAIQQVLRAEHLGRPAAVTAAYAATVRSLVAIVTTLNTAIANLEKDVSAHFGQHPDAEILLSQPGLGVVLGARALAEFGDAPDRYVNAKARKNYAGTSPVTRASGKTRIASARHVHHDRLVDALHMQATCAILHDKHVRTYYHQLRAAMSGTTQHYGRLVAGSSAFSTAASRPAPSTTRRPRGHTVRSASLLDVKDPGMSQPLARLFLPAKVASLNTK